jgi:hypothetical protein
MSDGYETTDDSTDDGSVTWVITHHVRPGRQDDFEEWIGGIVDELARFPGHEGVTVLRPGGESSTEYVLVVRFASYDDLRRWEESAERAEWLTRLEPLLAAESRYRTETGLETWFQLPGQRVVVPPPKWKMALLILLAIYPLLLIVLPLMGTMFDIPYLGVPITIGPEFVVRTFVTAVILVALMTWVAMPLLTKLFRGWLRPAPAGE